MRNKDMPQYVADSTDSDIYEYFDAQILVIEEGGMKKFQLTISRSCDGKLATRKTLNMASGHTRVTFPINISVERLTEIENNKRS